MGKEYPMSKVLNGSQSYHGDQPYAQRDAHLSTQTAGTTNEFPNKVTNWWTRVKMRIYTTKRHYSLIQSCKNLQMKVDSMFFFSLTWVMESPLRSPSKAERSLVPSLEFFDAKMQEKVLQKRVCRLGWGNSGTVGIQGGVEFSWFWRVTIVHVIGASTWWNHKLRSLFVICSHVVQNPCVWIKQRPISLPHSLTVSLKFFWSIAPRVIFNVHSCFVTRVLALSTRSTQHSSAST